MDKCNNNVDNTRFGHFRCKLIFRTPSEYVILHISLHLLVATSNNHGNTCIHLTVIVLTWYESFCRAFNFVEYTDSKEIVKLKSFTMTYSTIPSNRITVNNDTTERLTKKKQSDETRRMIGVIQYKNLLCVSPYMKIREYDSIIQKENWIHYQSQMME